jgi:hypothetical protein
LFKEVKYIKISGTGTMTVAPTAALLSFSSPDAPSSNAQINSRETLLQRYPELDFKCLKLPRLVLAKYTLRRLKNIPVTVINLI